MMGVYYYLMNDTKKEYAHLSHHLKYAPWSANEAVHYAVVNYMLENLGDNMRLISGESDEHLNYTETDLETYPYRNKDVPKEINSKLRQIYREDTKDE
jgi:hypothetical protein